VELARLWSSLLQVPPLERREREGVHGGIGRRDREEAGNMAQAVAAPGKLSQGKIDLGPRRSVEIGEIAGCVGRRRSHKADP